MEFLLRFQERRQTPFIREGICIPKAFGGLGIRMWGGWINICLPNDGNVFSMASEDDEDGLLFVYQKKKKKSYTIDSVWKS